MPFKKPETEHNGEDLVSITRAEPSGDALEILVLQPLEENDIRTFAAHRSAPDIGRLIRELERTDLMALAGRPFDLEEILDKWKAHLALGGRRELLHHSIERRLGEANPDRGERQPLNPKRARGGARALAAAVVLTGKTGIHIADGQRAQTGIDPQAILADWEPGEVRNLLARAVFDDVTYGAVRFRHRDVRELLAAEWFGELLTQGQSRHALEELFFRERYGEEFVSPRLRIVLPWLILVDRDIRNRVLATHPEIAVEGGDPAVLPLPVRKQILTEIVDRIACGEDDGSARDNHAIARIAQPDLAAQTTALIDQYADNDDAIFFLGRLVWQGDMSECVPPMLDLAAESARGEFARVAAARAVMTCGSNTDKSTLWNRVRATDGLPRRLLAELVRDAESDAATVPLVLESIERLVPHERFETTGLTQALHGFIDRLPLPLTASAGQPLSILLAGLGAILRRPPFIEESGCSVSAKFYWLLGPAIHAVERLVSSRAETAMDEPALAILLSAREARQWHIHSVEDYKDRLGDLVPAWPELNDRLFWKSVAATRTRREDKGERLDDDWPIHWPEHYWHFGPDSFDRIIEWPNTRDLEDDRLVALSLAVRVYWEAREPAEWLERLRALVTDDSALAVRLANLLNPPITEEHRERRRHEAERKRRRERRSREIQQRRLDWIGRLQADPELIRKPPGLPRDTVSQDQWSLLQEIEGGGLGTTRAQGVNWRSLIGEFGEDVAVAYRDAAMALWRHYRPGLRSEGADARRIPASVIFAMAGLEIEATEVDGFPAYLCVSEVRLALRYIVWELNGFPTWLESMHRAYSETTMEAIETELFWELTHAKPDDPMHYILHDLAVYSPWLYGSLVEPLLNWLRKNDPPGDDALLHILRILKGSCSRPAALAALAEAKAMHGHTSEHLPYWYAIWVDADPDTGIEAVTNWLSTLGREEGSRAAQTFIVALMGSGHSAGGPPGFDHILTPRHLKRLYVLMHEHIRASEDIDRAGGGVYSPELRDHAQEARNRLFQLLSDIPGKETYISLTELIEDHPNPNHRPWMARRATTAHRQTAISSPGPKDRSTSFLPVSR